MDLLNIVGLQVHFNSADGMVKAVNDVDLSVGLGETVALVGETGSGKTVLGLAAIGLLPGNIRFKGEVWYRGKNLPALTEKQLKEVRGREIAMIMQNPLSALNPSLTVGEQIAEVIREHRGVSRKEAKLRAKLVLGQTGLTSDRYGNYPHEFSGGMRQRAMIAIGLACQPALLIADEPTKGLDGSIQRQIVKLLRSLTREAAPPRSMLLITHDLGVAAELADRIAVMYCGKIVEFGRAGDILNNPIHPYTCGFLASHPRNGLKAIKGCSPSLIDLPAGCSFHPRCEKAQLLCCQEVPLVKSGNGQHQVRCHYA